MLSLVCYVELCMIYGLMYGIRAVVWYAVVVVYGFMEYGLLYDMWQFYVIKAVLYCLSCCMNCGLLYFIWDILWY